MLELDEAVAGATFMAAGGSAPELATSLITTFGSRDSTGLGTILGSAVFNLVVIIALSGMKGEGPDKKLQPMPFRRELNADRTKRGLGELPTGAAPCPQPGFGELSTQFPCGRVALMTTAASKA